MALKSEKCFGGKLSKERLTILFCVNMIGEKEKLLVIGKAARPRAFKNMKISDLPAYWKHNKKAWMTGDIMAEWLMQFDRRMLREKRNILLFLDNAASHPKDIILKNIKIVFLPPNTTSVCQPLDQGVIKNFKVHYRTAIIQNLLPGIEFNNSAKTLKGTINVLDALYFIKKSWEKVTAETIKNCFGKAGFTQNFNSVELDAEDDIPLSILSRLARENVDCVEFTTIDENLLTESDNIDVFVEEVNLSSSENDISIVEEHANRITSFKEALEEVRRLMKFSEEDYTAYEHLKYLECYYGEQILKENEVKLKQKNILDFFSTV